MEAPGFGWGRDGTTPGDAGRVAQEQEAAEDAQEEAGAGVGAGGRVGKWSELEEIEASEMGCFPCFGSKKERKVLKKDDSIRDGQSPASNNAAHLVKLPSGERESVGLGLGMGMSVAGVCAGECVGSMWWRCGAGTGLGLGRFPEVVRSPLWNPRWVGGWLVGWFGTRGAWLGLCKLVGMGQV